MAQVDREFVQPTSFFIKRILKGDQKAPIMDDNQVYGSLQVHNSKLKKQNHDFFFEHQLKNRIESLKVKKIKADFANKDTKQQNNISVRSKSLQQQKEELDLSTEEGNLRQSVLTDFKNQNNYGIQSSLKSLDRWVLLVEDGSNLATCNCIKVNIPRFLEKYDFEAQKNQLDRVEKYYMELT